LAVVALVIYGFALRKRMKPDANKQ
jgi:hypothetical protein